LKDPYPVSTRRQLLRWVLRSSIRMIFRSISRVSISGLENIPERGPYLIVSNHVSLYDPPLLLSFWPTPSEVAGAVEIWKRPGQSLLVRMYGTIPVHRGEFDRKLVDKMLAALHAGQPLMILPEGGRSHRPGLRSAEPGAAYIIEKTGVPVVPVGITGTTDDYLKRALRGEKPIVHMVIGGPLTLPPVTGKGEDRRRARQRNADLIMTHIASLLPEEYRGVYGQSAN
jgi:1-acyl-sn-glycerol-3-phosphate acyltransferase